MTGGDEQGKSSCVTSICRGMAVQMLQSYMYTGWRGPCLLCKRFVVMITALGRQVY